MIFNTKFKLKVLLVILISLTLLTTIIGTYSYNQVSKNVIESSFAHLSSIQHNKIDELHNWFDNLSALLLALSQQKSTQDYFKKLQESYYLLDKELEIPIDKLENTLLKDLEDNYLNKVNYQLPNVASRMDPRSYLPSSHNALIAQYLYTLRNNQTDPLNTNYGKLHEAYNGSYSKYHNAYNIYDIFMIDKKGNLIYTNIKEKDFGTNLIKGPFQNSGLAKVFSKALKSPKDHVVFEDFKPYEPSYNKSAAFVATPIFINNELQGVFAFQISITYLNKMMQFAENHHSSRLGKTGENFLIGTDYKLRSDLRFIKKISDPIIDKLNTAVGIVKIVSDTTKDAIENYKDHNSLIATDFKGDEVLSIYHQIKIFDDTTWYIVTQVQTKEALQQAREFKNNIIIICLTLFSILGLFIILYIRHMMGILQEKEMKLQKLLQSYDANVIASTTDTKGNITYASTKFAEISGYKPEELIGKPQNIVRHPESPKELFKGLWETIKAGKVWSGEIKNRTKTDDFYWVKATITPEFDEKGKIIGFSAIRQDITARKEVEALSESLKEKTVQLKELNEHLEEQIKKEVEKNLQKELQLFESAKLAAMGAMIGNIIHQWKQPLSYISLTAGTLQMDAELNENVPSSDVKKNMQNISDAVQRLSEVTNTFRNFLKEKKEIKEIVLQDRVKDSLVISGTVLKDKGVELKKDLDKEEPIKLTIVANELTEVIINIINNAIDVIEEKEIKKGWVAVDLYTQNGNAVITIEDNAGGIPKGVLPHIFDEYFSTKDDDKGTGLGLYMSHKIVTESLNGKLYAKNTENGAKFFIELPLHSSCEIKQ